MKSSSVTTITTPFIFRITVNCYLVKIEKGYILIDTGMPNQCRTVEQALERAGCQSGTLKLIILTHGDIDHCGNAAFFRQKFGSPIAMHDDDSGMVELGDMFWNRKKPNPFIKILFGRFFGFPKSKRFKPDIYVEDGIDLSNYGFDAEVLHLPGHSKGSIAILTATGDLFCGDLLENFNKPALGSIVDDADAVRASVNRLKHLKIGTI